MARYVLMHLHNNGALSMFLCIRKIICVLLQQLGEQKPDAVGNELLRQVALADVILLNKIDLVTDEHLNTISSRIR